MAARLIIYSDLHLQLFGTTRVHEKPRQVMNRRTSGISMRTFGEKTYGLVKSTVRRQGSYAKGREEPEGWD